MAGDGNLSRYVHNAPTYLVDPSGLVESEGQGSSLGDPLPIQQDKPLSGKLQDLDDEIADLENKFPGKANAQLRAATKKEILAEKKQLLKDARDADEVAKEHREIRKHAHEDPIEAQRSFDEAKQKRRVPEHIDTKGSDDRAKHHLPVIGEEALDEGRKKAKEGLGKRLLRKGGAAAPGIIGFGLTLFFVPGKVRAKGVAGAIVDETLDQLPLVDTVKAVTEVATGRDIIVDKDERPSGEEMRRRFPGHTSPEAGKRRSDMERGGVRLPPW